MESETWELIEILNEFHKELQLKEQCLVNSKDVRPSNSFQRGESLHSTSALFSESAKNKQFSRDVCGARFAIKIIRALNVIWSQVLSLESKF